MTGYRLLVMRLADMTRVHPDQDDSRVCSECGQPVGIYPSGQAVIKQHPETVIVCNVCNDADPPDVMILAPGAITEPFASTKKTKQ